MDELTKIEHQDQRVLTTQQLAEQYETEPQIITNNFNRNKERYRFGAHYFVLEGEEKRRFLCENQFEFSNKDHSKLYLWTEKGCLLHAKSLKTDKAWEVYNHLVDNYFRAKEMFNIPKSLPEALRMAADLAERLEKQAPLVAFAETAARSKNSILIRELAKVCCKNGIETGEKRLYKKLREWGLIMHGSTEPYQEYVDRGYFEVSEGTHENTKGVFLHKVTRVLPKGQQYVMNRLRREA